MIMNILGVIAAILIVFAIIVAMQPDDFRITRTATFNATTEQVFPYMNDLHKWQEWSPWARMDPNAKTAFEGPQAGVDAAMSWDGNNKIGTGRMTVIESKPNQLVKMKLEFFKPMKGVNTVAFAFKPEGDKTNVSWTMAGKSNFIAKAMGLILNCEKMVGEQFDQGFANLKPLVEAKS